VTHPASCHMDTRAVTLV